MMRNPWNELICNLPNPHLLQTYEWGQVKARYGWEPIYLVWGENGNWKAESDPALLSTFHTPIKAAALVLKKNVLRRNFAAQLCLLYCPKGPLLDWGDESLRKRVLDDLQSFARQQGAIFLKLDPDVVLGTGMPETETDTPEPGGEAVRADLSRRGWRYADDQIQFKNTVMLDVSISEEEMLARMKQKTRYNVRLGAKKGLTVRVGTEQDWPMLYKMYAETSVRDGFVIRDEVYYRMVWKTFENSSAPLIAELDGEALAAVYLFHFAGRAYYLYGMSRELHRELMPNYLLQWEAMKWAKAQGCHVYDLWGAPDEFNETDSMWGVFRFKEGLGGYVVRTVGAWDFAPNPLWYTMYAKVMPKVLDVMRSRGKARVRQGIKD
jgi:lipid II:glycine glycyltransferase (peptidoglycan interpeptide bridge formation enzyme)